MGSKVGMSIHITVAMMSGRSVDLELGRGITLSELSQRAQFLLGVRGRLLSASGKDLHGEVTLAQAGLQSGDLLTLHTRPVCLAAADSAMTAILANGTVVTWGYPGNGGDSNSAHDNLKNISQVQSTRFSFAAIRGDRTVVAWGNSACGGNINKVESLLKDVVEIQVVFVGFSLCDRAT